MMWSQQNPLLPSFECQPGIKAVSSLSALTGNTLESCKGKKDERGVLAILAVTIGARCHMTCSRGIPGIISVLFARRCLMPTALRDDGWNESAAKCNCLEWGEKGAHASPCKSGSGRTFGLCALWVSRASWSWLLRDSRLDMHGLDTSSRLHQANSASNKGPSSQHAGQLRVLSTLKRTT